MSSKRLVTRYRDTWAVWFLSLFCISFDDNFGSRFVSRKCHRISCYPLMTLVTSTDVIGILRRLKYLMKIPLIRGPTSFVTFLQKNIFFILVILCFSANIDFFVFGFGFLFIFPFFITWSIAKSVLRESCLATKKVMMSTLDGDISRP